MRVEVEAFSADVDYPEGNRVVAGVCLECTRCGHEVRVAGESGRSYRRGYMQLKSACPRGESNFYFCEDEPEDDL